MSLPNGISFHPAALAGCTSATDIQTDHAQICRNAAVLGLNGWLDKYRVIAAELVAGAGSGAVLLVRRITHAVTLSVASQRDINALGAVTALERRVGGTR